jgi:hypothetical protein
VTAFQLHKLYIFEKDSELFKNRDLCAAKRASCDPTFQLDDAQ